MQTCIDCGSELADGVEKRTGTCSNCLDQLAEAAK